MITGLGTEPRRDWPPPISARVPPIDALKPGSKAHEHVLDRLLSRIRASEQAIQSFYGRWQANERRVQAYLLLPDAEQVLKDKAESGEPPKITTLTIPYSFATINTIVTYLIHTFAGRKPLFQVGTYKGETAQAAKLMELMLQYNADHIRLVRHLFKYFWDGELYGVAILRCLWRTDKQARPVWRTRPKTVLNLPLPGTSEEYRASEERTIFEGTDVVSVDPFMFFPDPRVPMSEVNRRGEYVFWRTFEGRHTLRREESAGRIKWTSAIDDKLPTQHSLVSGSARSGMPGGEPHAGRITLGETGRREILDYVQIDQGTVELIPAQWGLGKSEKVQKWLFSIGNQSQIIQAEPFQDLHDLHPVAVIEPYSMGYGLGHPAISDYLGSFQDGASWLMNSHIFNIRAALNNMFVVDPSAIEMQDIRNPEPGKLIRLKTAAIGRDVRTVVSQFPVADVTQSHIKDLKVFMDLGDMMSAVNENMRGQQTEGGRKTATEIRVSSEAGASRLAAHAKRISAMGMVDLVTMMSINYQQYLDPEFYVEVTGVKGMESPIQVTPQMLIGDFHYPVHDGTLPIDRMALLEVWKEIYQGMMQNPELAQSYNMPGIFEYIAELSGAKGIINFKVQPDQQVQQQAQAGNAVPMQQLSQLGMQQGGNGGFRI